MSIGVCSLGHSFGFNLSKIKFDAQKKTLENVGLDFSEIEDSYKDAEDLQDLYEYFKKIGGYNKFKPESKQEQLDAWLAGNDNKCSDGNDDGKIGFFAKVGNFFEGIAKTVVGSIESFRNNPKKTTKFVATCVAMAALVTVGGTIGWAIAAAAGLYGAANLIIGGVKDFIEATQIAENATTDAEAKEAYEQMGSGTLQVGIGVVCARASVSGCKAGPQQTTFIDELESNLEDISVLVDES